MMRLIWDVHTEVQLKPTWLVLSSSLRTTPLLAMSLSSLWNEAVLVCQVIWPHLVFFRSSLEDIHMFQHSSPPLSFEPSWKRQGITQHYLKIIPNPPGTISKTHFSLHDQMKHGGTRSIDTEHHFLSSYISRTHLTVMLHLWLGLKIFNVDARITRRQSACNIQYFELCTFNWSRQNEYTEADVSAFKETPAEFSGDGGTHRQAWAWIRK